MKEQPTGEPNKEIPHITIVMHPKGYVAHIRYKDRFKDKDLSASSIQAIDALVDEEVMGL